MGYDALLLVSFGGPDGPQDVLPFLRRVTAGRAIPDARLAEVAGHYEAVGGVSPINGENRRLLEGLRDRLAPLPVYWGNRNSEPFLADTVAEMAADGVRRAAAFVTSAFSSYSGCRQYREDIERARASTGSVAPVIDKLRVFYNHPAFLEPLAGEVRAALQRSPGRLVFTAHSIPEAMSRASPYVGQLREAARLVSQLAGAAEHDLVWQSRSGSPATPWLEPDINDHVRRLAATGTEAVVVCPIGFLVDHMEVVHDLDTEAAATARELGLHFERVGTIGQRLVALVAELLAEREQGAPRRFLGRRGPSHDLCPAGCCLRGENR